jgi:hypothetical protein
MQSLGKKKFPRLSLELEKMINVEADYRLIEKTEDQGIVGAFLVNGGIGCERSDKVHALDDGRASSRTKL